MLEDTISTQEEWQAERDRLLVEEKELHPSRRRAHPKATRAPWVPVEKEYGFETEDGAKSLPDSSMGARSF